MHKKLIQGKVNLFIKEKGSQNLVMRGNWEREREGGGGSCQKGYYYRYLDEKNEEKRGEIIKKEEKE